MNNLLSVLWCFGLLLGCVLSLNYVSKDKCENVYSACRNVKSSIECNRKSQCENYWKDSVNLDGKDTTACAMCELLVTDVKLLVDRQFTSSEIAIEAKKLCLELPTDPSKQLCFTYVDSYLKTVLSSLAKNDHKTVSCQSMQFCANTPMLVAPLSYWQKFKKTTNNRDAEDTCVECNTLFDDLLTSFDNDYTQTDIATVIDNLVCKEFRTEFREACSYSAESSSQKITSLIKQNQTSLMICQHLEVCSYDCSDNTHVPKTSPELCSTCKEVVTDFVNYVTDRNNVAKFEQYLTMYCSMLHASTNCNVYINEYLPLVITYIREEINSTNLCENLRLCPHVVSSGDADSTKSSFFRQSFGSPCTLCHTILTSLDNYMPLNETANDIVHSADKVCEEMPIQYRDHCTTIINSYGQRIVYYVVRKGTVEGICIALQFCDEMVQPSRLINAKETNAPAVLAAEQTVAIKKTLPKKADNCRYCSNLVEVFFQLPKTRPPLDNDIIKLCRMLPSEIQKTCLRFPKNMHELYLSELSGNTPLDYVGFHFQESIRMQNLLEEQE